MRVWTGTPGGGHTLVGQECVQCWVALGPCAAEYCEYGWVPLVARTRWGVAAGQLYWGCSGAGHRIHGLGVAGCTLSMIPEFLVLRVLHCLGRQIAGHLGLFLHQARDGTDQD